MLCTHLSLLGALCLYTVKERHQVWRTPRRLAIGSTASFYGDYLLSFGYRINRQMTSYSKNILLHPNMWPPRWLRLDLGAAVYPEQTEGQAECLGGVMSCQSLSLEHGDRRCPLQTTNHSTCSAFERGLLSSSFKQAGQSSDLTVQPVLLTPGWVCSFVPHTKLFREWISPLLSPSTLVCPSLWPAWMPVRVSECLCFFSICIPAWGKSAGCLIQLCFQAS